MAASVFLPTYGAVGTDLARASAWPYWSSARFLVDPTSARIKLIIVERKPAGRIPVCFCHAVYRGTGRGSGKVRM